MAKKNFNPWEVGNKIVGVNCEKYEVARYKLKKLNARFEIIEL